VPVAAALVLLAALFGLVPVASAEDAAPSPAGGGLDLSMRTRGLGVERAPTSNLDFETVKAPTGAGSTRLPQAASGRAGGIYVGVIVCDPIVGGRAYEVRADDPGSLPEPNLRGAAGPRTLFVPGRP
jgi:hypothetical protein